MFDFLLKGKNFDSEILKLLKEKISLNVEVAKTFTGKKLRVSLNYKDDANQMHLISSSEIDMPE